MPKLSDSSFIVTLSCEETVTLLLAEADSRSPPEEIMVSDEGVKAPLDSLPSERIIGVGSFGAASGSSEKDGSGLVNSVLMSKSAVFVGCESADITAVACGRFAATTDDGEFACAFAAVGLLATGAEFEPLFLKSRPTTATPIPSKITLVDHGRPEFERRSMFCAGTAESGAGAVTDLAGGTADALVAPEETVFACCFVSVDISGDFLSVLAIAVFPEKFWLFCRFCRRNRTGTSLEALRFDECLEVSKR